MFYEDGAMWLQIWRQSSRKGTEEVGKQWISSQGRWSTWPGVLVHFQGRLHASTFWSLLVQTSIFHFFTSLLLTMQRWSVNSGRKLLVRHCITPLTFQEVAWRNSSSFLFCSYPFLPSYTQENQSCIKKKAKKKRRIPMNLPSRQITEMTDAEGKVFIFLL